MVPILSTLRMILIGFATLAAALGLFLMSVGASPPGQEPYPPPYPSPCPCAVVVSTDEAAPSTDECILITCQVTDGEGAPTVGTECTMSILSQPGTDATLTQASVTTDEKGEATAELCGGSAPGPIVVLAEAECCQGQLEVTVQEPTAALPEATPPAKAPPTGAGTGTSDGNSWSAPLIAIWSGIALAAGAVLVWQISSRRRRSS
jgi:hypothetical protein